MQDAFESLALRAHDRRWLGRRDSAEFDVLLVSLPKHQNIYFDSDSVPSGLGYGQRRKRNESVSIMCYVLLIHKF